MGCWGYGVLVMWDVQDVGYLGSGMFGCGMFKISYVWDVECSGCGMLGL